MRTASILFVLFALALPGCKFSCSVGKDVRSRTQTKIEEDLLTNHHVKVEVTCPELKKKQDARCDVKTEDGVTFPVLLSWTDDDWSYQTEGVGFGSKIEAKFRKLYSEQMGFSIEKITCPKLVSRGIPATCQGEHQGIAIPIGVEITDKDELNFVPKGGLLLIGKLEGLLLAKDKHGATRVDCGKARLMVSKPNTKFRCGHMGPEGVLGTTTVIIKDVNGNVDFQ